MTHSKSLNVSDRRAMCAEIGITLNGEPAKISGAFNSCGTVGRLDQPLMETEYSWQCIKRVVSNGGNFKL